MDKQTRPGESEAVVSVILGITSCVFVILTYLFWQKAAIYFLPFKLIVATAWVANFNVDSFIQ